MWTEEGICRAGSMSERSLDKILIRNLRARCIVGIFPDERSQKQDVVINMTLYADLQEAGASDRIEDTVDYKDVKQAVFALVEESSFYLVERLAEAVAQAALTYDGVERVEVTIDKPGALRFADSVAVCITRDRARG